MLDVLLMFSLLERNAFLGFSLNLELFQCLYFFSHFLVGEYNGTYEVQTNYVSKSRDEDKLKDCKLKQHQHSI